ncbi:APC family permease [Streptomyces cuspidosporus]|uniref:APC family permease n=1 Tax=Streptomyces cuspidosporus TaxID=66882 RepID=UPI0031FC687C
MSSDPPNWLPHLVALIVLLAAAVITVFPARRGADLLLMIEGATVVLILLISAVVIYRISTGHGPQGQECTLSVFRPAESTGTSALFLGAVFGFLAFAGFESAATLGEEAREPRRAIPRAVTGTVLIGGVFYIVTSAVEVMGFGTRASDLARLHNSGSLYGDLGGTYLSAWVGDIVAVGTTVSALGGAIGCLIGASRMLLSLSRAATTKDTVVTRVSKRYGTPVGAVGVASAVMLVSVVVFGWVARVPVALPWAWIGTVGTLIVLVVYLLATVGAAGMLLRTRRVPRWELVIPAASVAVLGYTLYRNVVPYPTGAAFWLPITAGAWIAVALAAVLLSPALVRRIGRRLTEEEGLA